MLEFKKRVLKSVSFDQTLFEKELTKAVKWLMPEELEELRKWCYSTFNNKHHVILDRCFN